MSLKFNKRLPWPFLGDRRIDKYNGVSILYIRNLKLLNQYICKPLFVCRMIPISFGFWNIFKVYSNHY